MISSYYPQRLSFSGTSFGREGLVHFLSLKRETSETRRMEVTSYELADNKSNAVITGVEILKSNVNGVEITQPWKHQVRFGPNGRIIRLKLHINVKEATGDWSKFDVQNPYGPHVATAMKSIRALCLSLHDFTVHHVIGKGGFGTVVNAVKKSDGQVYALKILEKQNMSAYDISSSYTEMIVAQHIHHPFIAGLRIAFQSRTKIFLGMTYYSGGDLYHHMGLGPTTRIADARAKFYAAQLVLAIHHLHQHDVIYRDIKPENVMLDSEGNIALVDFGLAKIHVSDYKGAKTMAGSPQYTAPELLHPKATRSYGKTADWWSLGILLYEMTIGKSPFLDSNVDRMYKKILRDELPFPSRPVVPEALYDILTGVRSCLYVVLKC